VVSGAPGTYVLSGDGLINGVQEYVFGDTVVTISTPLSDIPPPDILAFWTSTNSTAVLTFTSVVNQAYAVLTNRSLLATNGWAECLPVTGECRTHPAQRTGCRLESLLPRTGGSIGE
jgi:hypothetical protein